MFVLLKKGLRYITDSDYRFIIKSSKDKCRFMTDEQFVNKMFRIRMGYELNLNDPHTFNEKLQWLKLYYHDPMYTMMADKIKAKEYVASILGTQYIVPTIGTWDDPLQIDFSSLPTKYVLKCNHNSGEGMFICNNNMITSKAILDLKHALSKNYYYTNREWQYKNIEPKVLAEKYLENPNDEINGLIDYKFYCFNGEPKFFYLGYANIINGKKHDQLSYYTLDWMKAPFYRTDHNELSFEIPKPSKWDEMVEIAKILSKNIPFVRVDLYYVENQILFSEFTFTPGSGYGAFSPNDWEEKIGSWIHLPEKRLND